MSHDLTMGSHVTNEHVQTAEETHERWVKAPGELKNETFPNSNELPKQSHS